MNMHDGKIWLVVVTVSLASHAGFLGYIDSSEFKKNFQKKPEKPLAVKIAVVEKPVEQPPKPPEPKPLPKPKPKPKDLVKKVASLTKKEPAAVPNEAKPIQGLNKDSFVPGKGGFQAPVGNTLMTADEGIRVNEAPELQQDLSADAKLVAESLVKPAYTDDALDIGLEGVFTIDVFVDEIGSVSDVDIRKKIGYGMDARIIESVKTAKFLPRKDSMGTAIKGWAVISFRLTIP
jgi:protein TonB